MSDLPLPDLPAAAAAAPARGQPLSRWAALRRAWREDGLGYACGLFLGSRAVLLLLAVVAPIFILPGEYSRGLPFTTLFRDYWVRWDGDWYVRIAEQGYHIDPVDGGSVNFFPLLPLLIRVVSWTGVGAPLAGILLANAAALLAIWWMYRLVRDETGRESVAQLAAALLAFNPRAAWHSLGFTEPIFVCLMLGLFREARAGRWWRAAALGLGCGLCRPNGLVLAAPLLVLAWPALSQVWRERRWQRLAPLGAALAAPVAGFLCYLLYLQVAFGDWGAQFQASRVGWGTQVSIDPVRMFPKVPGLGLELLQNAGGQELAAWSWLWTCLGMGLALVVLCRREFPRWWLAFHLIYCGLIVSVSQPTGLVVSIGRYTSTVLTIYFAAAWLVADRPALRIVFLGLSTALMALGTVLLFAGYHFS